MLPRDPQGGVQQQDKNQVQMPTREKDEIRFTIFPNPVVAGSLLTISFNEPVEMPEVVQLYTSGGLLLASMRQTATEEATVFNIAIPVNAEPGVYFLRLLNRKWGRSYIHKVSIR